MGPIYLLKSKPKIRHLNTLRVLSLYSGVVVVVVFINKWFKCSEIRNLSSI